MEHFPTVADFNRARVTNPDQSETIKGRLYDRLLYAAAGQQQLTFFAQPIGQGVTTELGAAVGSPKMLGDTNMALAGQTPSGLAFRAESVEFLFEAGASAAANTFTLALPSQFSLAAGAAALTAQVNDVRTFYAAGSVTWTILVKPYLQETNPGAFPPKVFFEAQSSVAVATTVAAQTTEAALVSGRQCGTPYYLDVPITLLPAQNFSIVIQYSGLVPLPSTLNGRVTCILDGHFLRASQ